MKPGRREEVILRAALRAARAADKGLEPGQSDSVLRRVSADLESSKVHENRQAWRWLLAGGLAAVAATLLVVASGAFLLGGEADLTTARSGPVISVVYRQGQVRTGPSETLLDTTVLGADASVLVGAEARLDLEIAGVARIAVTGPARLTRAAGGDLRLVSGGARLQVEAQPADQPFLLIAGDSELVVHGTKFWAVVDDDRLLAAGVDSGEVEVRELALSRAPVLLHAGDVHQAGASFDTSLTPRRGVFDTPWWRARAQGRTAEAHLEVTSTPTDAVASIAGQPIGRTPVLVMWPVGALTAEVEAPGYNSWQADLELEVQSRAKIHAALSKQRVIAKDKAGPTDSWQLAGALLAEKRCAKLDLMVRRLSRTATDHVQQARGQSLRAECYLRSGNKLRALPIYQQLVRGYATTGVAEAAMLEIAKIQVELGRKSDGLATTQRYLETYPQGRFIAEATLSRCELLVDIGRADTGRTCLEQFQRAYPSSLGSNRALLLLGSLARLDGRWSDAAKFYRRYLAAAPASSHADHARFGLVAALRAGGLAGFEEAARDFLANHPGSEHAAEVEKWLK